jgi:hypothetical protein
VKATNHTFLTEEAVEDTKSVNHTIASIGWGALLIWWGISFMIGPITLGMSAIGTGLIMLGLNTVRMIMHIPTNHSTHDWGVILLVWGILDQSLALSFERSAAAMLIIIGAVSVLMLLLRRKPEQAEQATGL